MRKTFVVLGLLAAGLLGLSPAAEAKRAKAVAPPAPTLDAQTINDAAPPAEVPNAPGQKGKGKAKSKPKDSAKTKAVDPVAIKAGILLDRARFSPGAIDGRPGENLDKAIKAFQAAQGLQPSGNLDPDTWARLTQTSTDPAVIDYAITPEDAKGPFLDKIPPKMEEMEGLKRLSYTSAREELAEKFHMSEALLQALNPGKNFEEAGTQILVANVAAAPAADKSLKGKVARIEINKAARALQAFDADGKLLAFYPASIGSEEKPAPSGTLEVRAVAENPTYTYNPEYQFKGVKTDRKFTIAAGPNNPVGAVWIDLSLKSYGIHGTPEPERVGKTYSHGCVRLTNWDVKQLASMVKKGTVVDFKD
jgi:lipoprotein-anchoring transpeptidase ErfK/SrfK